MILHLGLGAAHTRSLRPASSPRRKKRRCVLYKSTRTRTRGWNRDAITKKRLYHAAGNSLADRRSALAVRGSSSSAHRDVLTSAHRPRGKLNPL